MLAEDTKISLAKTTAASEPLKKSMLFLMLLCLSLMKFFCSAFLLPAWNIKVLSPFLFPLYFSTDISRLQSQFYLPWQCFILWIRSFSECQVSTQELCPGNPSSHKLTVSTLLSPKAVSKLENSMSPCPSSAATCRVGSCSVTGSAPLLWIQMTLGPNLRFCFQIYKMRCTSISPRSLLWKVDEMRWVKCPIATEDIIDIDIYWLLFTSANCKP